MDKIYRVNMTDLKVKEEKCPSKYAAAGGRGLTSSIVNDEVPATCHPLGIHNKLILAPGLLSGTSAACSGRMSFGGKSPLTGAIKESNVGGIASQKLAKCNVKAIIIEGMPKDNKFYMLEVTKDGVKIVPANDLAGIGTYELNKKLWDKYGKVGVICIGVAGEERMCNAGISVNDPEGGPGRFAGRGGLGAVMGSKKIKAIIVDDKGADKVPIKDEEKFKNAAKVFSQVLLKHPVTGEALPNYGTAVLVNILNEAGGFPTKNFRRGRFETAANISGEKIAEVAKARGGEGKAVHACHPGCVIRCSNIYPDKNGKAITAPMEYESVWSLGANLEVDDLDKVAQMIRICSDTGLDTIESGVTLAVAAEAGLAKWGDADSFIKLLQEIGKKTPLGKILGQGAAVTGRVFGISRVAAVKGQGLPAYDPRTVKGIGVTYATSTMGGDHTAGYAVLQNILKVGGDVNPLKPEGQVDVSRAMQIATATVDCTGLCLFVAIACLDLPEGLQAIIDMINAEYGTTLTVDDIPKIGTQVIKTELEFNRKAGFTKADDRLPEFFDDEKCPPHNITFEIKPEELDKVWANI
ncbi:MAG: aldehyde ferredoxin oxidoreductase [Candidatus Schekmanbacteria bacterium RIFCSPHIGHO2_02_FULL_38_11]|uniref:Aldehyde ferredoxin oxidoreductase n=1 Tax=Candidatus Schekmanbacteria bacterium RIFCSPLOWO2_12_FULL_38_15 TaxID=1817883 RepID=A0A1F7SIH0_9BACT|nr:MAG: aldehyde ferredoxin oxidoreductase [Candidatus Schekmanbacteria bacterium GWA2_38_9]OGL49651.1 MAG: aldehyde ferredoxin oxidoreductase [Candidatus Schekmanbacteria bacterium RIFCSPLOWO2_02_FULL_38_14]OGL50373.1 MAG: aldehyde ferredoxin oxidoreductase [Candidatus Schekmanbacteria bacterium RIFCSPHIGHO2_02_FULL_38_11]OGL53004.1 MAG: aldehyde ferredoxin oxidoreductase [Candidatus Schekmanbacteria bacterium RIFCSPLOWO2_12_FULL_38_15]